MRIRLSFYAMGFSVVAATIGAAPVWPQSPANSVAKDGMPRQAAERGLAFLEADALKWRKERECSTCHHGTLTVWALSEAKTRGYSVSGATLAEMTRWTKDRLFERLDLPRDSRPGWSMVNTPALYLALMARAVPQQTAITEVDLRRIGGHLLRHQEADGSWSWASAPAKNRPPPVFESDEVATLLGYLALGTQLPRDAKAPSEARDSREKAVNWLAKHPPEESTQAASLRLFRDILAGKSARELRFGIDGLLGRQNEDGGWGQQRGFASDAYATGQALYFLSWAGVKSDRAEIGRGVSFLLKTQNADGSWPMVARSHPGATPAGFTVPITYLGSAWATLGLMRSGSR